MFSFFSQRDSEQSTSMPSEEDIGSQTLKALWSALPMIEFKPDGTIIRANPLFLSAIGYRSEEIEGQHHKIFCDEDTRGSEAYRRFWAQLAEGNVEQGLFKRVDKAGKDLWLEASYVPVPDAHGKVVKVVKIAADVTERVNRANELEGEAEAVSRSMAVIEFRPDGTIIRANENFNGAMGYAKDELVGKHHRIFCDSSYVASPEYAQLWQNLNNGQFFSGKIKRIDSQGEVKWLEATYNPIFDIDGKLFKVMKFASDVTESVAYGERARDLAMESSHQTEEQAAQGMQVVDKAISAMQSVTHGLQEASESIGSLSEQSDRIGNIVSTITAIADQTNLLALNAAIEAARAGEQGRGFAVVADEVRNLAARTSDSTAEIEDVVKRNTELAGKAVGAMEQIVNQSHQSTELIEETGSAIRHISKSTQEMVNIVSELGNNNT